MKKGISAKPYTGVLINNILLDEKYHSGRFIGGDKGRKKSIKENKNFPQSELREVERQRDEKFPTLFKHYEIPETSKDKWELLARALANNHIEGFKYRYKTGRPETNDRYTLCEFYRAFKIEKSSQIKNGKRVNDYSILHDLKKDLNFQMNFPHLKKVDIKTLENKLGIVRSMRKERIRFMLRVCELSKNTSSIDSLDPALQAPKWYYNPTPLYEKYTRLKYIFSEVDGNPRKPPTPFQGLNICFRTIFSFFAFILSATLYLRSQMDTYEVNYE